MKSLYHSTRKPSLKPADPYESRRCFVVPGQGSAYPGMFADLLTSDEDFRRLFTEADRAAGHFDLLPISTYITRPQVLPKEKLHIYRNCALFTAEAAIGLSLIRRGIVPDSVTGHSFGECAGIVIAGLVSFEEMLTIVIHRNLLCPPAHELGMMITLSAGQEKLAPLFEIPGIFSANLNSPKQSVISVATAKKEEALEWLRKNRVPHLLLQELPQPYHSPLMEPYRKLLRDRIAKLPLTIHEPSYDFFSGIFHCWITRENYRKFDFVDLLSRQFTEPVNFIEQIEAVSARGTLAYYETGPGKMLEHSLRSILPESKLVYRDMDSHFPLLVGPRKKAEIRVPADSKWFPKIREIIRSVTGYSEKDIQIENSFQNDLGIDSLRKAEILVRLIKEQGLNPGADFSITRFSYIHEAVEYLENYNEESDPLIVRHEKKIQNLHPVWTEAGLPVLGYLDEHRIWELSTVPADQFAWKEISHSRARAARSGKKCLVIIEGNDPEIPVPEYLLKIHAEYAAFLSGPASTPLHFIILDHTREKAFFPLAGLLRSLSKETRLFTTGIVFAGKNELSPETLLKEASLGQLRDVSWETGKRRVKELLPVETNTGKPRPLRILAIGGSKGIGFELFSRLPEDCCESLFLTGRTPEEDPEISAALAVLRKRWRNFTYVSLEAAKLSEKTDDVSRFFNGEKIDVLLNSAGMEVSRPFETRTVPEIVEELESKIQPFRSAEEAGRILGVDRILHFTSVVSQFGNKGQATYSWSNSWMESHLGERSHALAWAPWERTGMTNNEGLLQKIREWGISLIDPEEGIKLFCDVLLMESLPKVIVPMDRKDVFLFGAEQFRGSHLGDLIQNFEGVFYREVRLEKDPWLKDHVLLGQNLVPAAFFISQLLGLARAHFGRFTAISDLNVHNALMIEGGHSAFKLQAFLRPPFEFNISSIITHLTGRFDPEKTLSPKRVQNGLNERPVDLSTFYDDNGFGASFQFIRRAYVDEKRQVRIAVKKEEIPALTGDPHFDFWLVVLDMCFQSLTMQMKLIDGGAIIPLSFGELVFTDDMKITGEFSFRPQVTEVKDKFGKATATFADDKGNVFCELRDIRFKIHYFKTITPIAILEEE